MILAYSHLPEVRLVMVEVYSLCWHSDIVSDLSLELRLLTTETGCAGSSPKVQCESAVEI